MRVVPPCQLALPIGGQDRPADRPAERWAALPAAQRAEVLALLGRLIARGVLCPPGEQAQRCEETPR